MSLELYTKISRHDCYGIMIDRGMLSRFPTLLASLDFNQHIIVITDATVNALYGNSLMNILSNSQCRLKADRLIIVPGEKSKSLENVTFLYKSLIDIGAARRSLIIALGGGVVLDIAGFVASTYMRGIPYVNVPTSLLAQCDASVGGKVGINHSLGKNLIGAFWNPKLVCIDTNVLTTLCPNEIQNGLGEIIKIGIIASPSLFNYVETHWREALNCDLNKLEFMIYDALEKKLALLDDDPYESNLRRALNFGHTFGHAIETLTSYSGINHGQAIAIGIALATEIASNRRICNTEVVSRIQSLLRSIFSEPPNVVINAENLWDTMNIIRMIRNNNFNFVLPTDLGQFVFTDDITLEELKKALKKLKVDGD